MTAMQSLFTFDGQTDAAGVEWSIGGLDDINPLLIREHYLGPLYAGGYELIVMGVVDDEVVAAMVWRLPTSRHIPTSWLELSRWCLTPAAGENAGSRMHKYAVRMIRERLADVTTLVSYSDPGHGHTGALYRACNWQWFPTWQRLRPPPSGNGAWIEGQNESVKDRWIFPVRKDPKRQAVLEIEDTAAIRFWKERAADNEIRWATHHPQLQMTERNAA